jgi:hypothetical protein
MATLKNLRLLAAVLVVSGTMVFLSGCQKQDTEYGNYNHWNQSDERLSADQEELVKTMVNNVQNLRFWNPETDDFYDFNVKTREFTFAGAPDGMDFSNTDGVQWFGNPNGGGVLIIPFGALGTGGGGTVIAGNSALDIAYTFCFKATDEALGLDLFDFGLNIEGISLVLGIAGDFEALMEGNVDGDSEFTDFFQGFAMYVVYDDDPQGTFDILNWLNDLEDEADDLADHGFSYVIDFTNFSIYFSKTGTLNVSGGSMNFSGTYFALLELLTVIEDYDDIQFANVPGFGAMGCD